MFVTQEDEYLLVIFHSLLHELITFYPLLLQLLITKLITI